MIRLKLWTVVTTVLLCLPAAAMAQAIPSLVPDQAGLAAEVASLTQRLAEAREAEANGQVSRGSVVAIERQLVAAKLELAQTEGETKSIPELLQRQVALEEEEVKRLEALQGSGLVSGGPLATALEKLVAAKTRLAESKEERPEVKGDLERLVSLREAEVTRVKEAAKRGVVSGSQVTKAEEKLAAAQARLEEALKPPPEPTPTADEEALTPDVPDLPTP